MTAFSGEHFCTLFDSSYLVKGLAMLRSLVRHAPGCTVHVLCLDDTTREVLEAVGPTGVRCQSLEEVEDGELRAARSDRSWGEYCWTLASAYTWHVLSRDPAVGRLTYLDADLWFFSDVTPLLAEIGSASIAVTEHRYAPHLRALEANGRFCVQWVSFRRDEEGLACLERWRRQCLAWCHHRLERGRMGDQKYLDDWPRLYRSCHVVRHAGAGVAPWNYVRYMIRETSDGTVWVDDVPLIFYHFHQFEILRGGGFDRMCARYGAGVPPPEPVYRRYEAAVEDTIRLVRETVPGFACGMRSRASVRAQRLVQRYVPRAAKDALRRLVTR